MAELTREHFDSTMRLHQAQVQQLGQRVGAVELRLHEVERHALPGMRASQSDASLEHFATMAGAGAAIDKLAASQNVQNDLLRGITVYLAQVHKKVVEPVARGSWWKRPRVIVAGKAAVVFFVAVLGAYLGAR